MWFYPWITVVVLNAVAMFVSLPIMGLWTAFFVHMVICGGLILYMEFKVEEEGEGDPNPYID